MSGDPITRNLIRCGVCGTGAYCVGFDATHAYYECSGSPARHQWSEERDPLCFRCDEQLSEHRLFIAAEGGDRELICPGSLEDNTFAYGE